MPSTPALDVGYAVRQASVMVIDSVLSLVIVLDAPVVRSCVLLLTAAT